MIVTPEALAGHIARAERMRSDELARLFGLLVRAPGRLLARFKARRADTSTGGRAVRHA